METMIAYKYRIYPTKEQKVLFEKTFGCVRFLWNKCVESFNTYDKDTNPKPKIRTQKELKEEFPWLYEVCAGALQQKEIDFKRTKDLYFKGKVERPKIHHKTNSGSYSLPDRKYQIRGNNIWLEKIGLVEIKLDRIIPKNVKYYFATVSKTPDGKYFVSITFKTEKKQLPKTGKKIGIDLGLKEFLVTSEGEKVQPIRFFRDSQSEIGKMQKIQSRKTKDSNRYKKNQERIARLHKKAANKRKHVHHCLSKKLVKENDFIALETLDTKQMLQNKKMSKSISDASWSSFVGILEYKAKNAGRTIQKISKWYPSSKLCSECGYKNVNLTLKDREWICPQCGCQHDRDINAAKNILKEGLRLSSEALGITSAIRTQRNCQTEYDAESEKLITVKRSKSGIKFPQDNHLKNECL